ncbi:MAG: signal peptide peptidase SppA [Solirubrobacterales bacterium]
MAKKLLIALIAAACLVTIFAAFRGGIGGNAEEKSLGQDSIALIRVEGVISGDAQSGLLGEYANSLEDTLDALKRAREDDRIKAVVIRINSPGGTVAASQEISEEIEKVSKAGKPVIASMGDVAASGGYYLAVSCDKIMANPGTLTGSIGVIMEAPNVEGLFEKLGIRTEVIKSGAMKDIGSATRTMTPAERELLQMLVMDSYEQFLGQVEKGRKGKISPEKLRALADGRVFTGRQAKTLGLIDAIGNFPDAVKLAAKEADLSDNAPLVDMQEQDPWARILNSLNALNQLTGPQAKALKAQY